MFKMVKTEIFKEKTFFKISLLCEGKPGENPSGKDLDSAGFDHSSGVRRQTLPENTRGAEVSVWKERGFHQISKDLQVPHFTGCFPP